MQLLLVALPRGCTINFRHLARLRSTFGYLLFAALGLVGLLTAVVCYIGYTFAKQSQPWGPVIFVAGLLRSAACVP